MTMPDHAPPRKSRRWLFIPYLLVLALAVVWSGAWFYGRSRLVEATDKAQRSQDAGGYSLSWASRSVGGFPFRFDVKLKDVRFAERSGWGVTVPDLEAMAAAYAPTKLVAVAADGMVITRPGKGAVAVKGEVLRASLSGFPGAPRLSVEGTKLSFAPVAGGQASAFSAAERFELHLRPQAGDREQLFMKLEGAAPSPNTLLASLSAGATAGVLLEAAVDKPSTMRGVDWPTAIRKWSAAGGVLNINRGEVSVGKGVVKAGATALTADETGRLQGPLPLSLTSGPTAMLALGATGVLPPQTASVAAGLAGALPDASATLFFRDGQTFLGPLPIGPSPRLY